MVRKLTCAIFALIAASCGDDDSGAQREGDAGGAAYDTNAQAKVINVGAACTSSSDCSGLMAECQQTGPFGIGLPGGMCGAPCTSDSECGLDGKCPLAPIVELAQQVPLLASLASSLSVCLLPCASEAACRSEEGYHCQSLQRLIDTGGSGLGAVGGQAAMVPGVIDTFCLPLALPSMDASVPALDAAATDAGPDGG